MELQNFKAYITRFVIKYNNKVSAVLGGKRQLMKSYEFTFLYRVFSYNRSFNI